MGREFCSVLLSFSPNFEAIVRNEDVLKPLQFCYQRDKRPRIGKEQAGHQYCQRDTCRAVALPAARFEQKVPIAPPRTFLREALQRGRFHADNICY